MTEKKEAGREDPGELKDDANDAGGTVDREGPPKSGANNATVVPAAKSSDNAREEKTALFDTRGFQWIVAAMLVLITVALSTAMFVLVLDANQGTTRGNGRWEMAFFTVLIGLFGVLITGLFVFMAFRIDRGAKSEAQRVAEKVAEKVAERAAEDAERIVRERAEEVAKEVAAEAAEKVATRAEKEAIAKVDDAAKRVEETLSNAIRQPLGEWGKAIVSLSEQLKSIGDKWP